MMSFLIAFTGIALFAAFCGWAERRLQGGEPGMGWWKYLGEVEGWTVAQRISLVVETGIKLVFFFGIGLVTLALLLLAVVQMFQPIPVVIVR
jgi:hypothetical protein